jgi:hypothetical protein
MLRLLEVCGAGLEPEGEHAGPTHIGPAVYPFIRM